MATITAKDLTKEFPRSPYEELDGFPWLARLIDKVRALQAGTLGEYTPFPCGGDRRFLATAGIDADALKDLIFKGASDAEILAYIKAHAVPDAAERLVDYRKQQRSGYTDPDMVKYLDDAKQEIAKAHPGLDLSKVQNFSHLICLEEGHPLP